jgi:hypothetical protein
MDGAQEFSWASSVSPGLKPIWKCWLYAGVETPASLRIEPFNSARNPGHFEPKLLSVATAFGVLLYEGGRSLIKGPKLVP